MALGEYRCPNCGYGTSYCPVVAPVHARPPALCPVCRGRGSVPANFYDDLGVAASTNRQQCRSCKGRGVL